MNSLMSRGTPVLIGEEYQAHWFFPFQLYTLMHSHELLINLLAIAGSAVRPTDDGPVTRMSKLPPMFVLEVVTRRT